MPQDIPLEASEQLVFHPKAFANLSDAPSFVLRAATTRDKRYHRRLHLEENIVSHSTASIRAEILRGLKHFWSPEAFDQHAEVLKTYWDARDEYDQQKELHDKAEAGKSEPAPFPPFDHDPEIAEACEELIRKVVDAWRPVRTMVADNADFQDLTAPAMVAVVVKAWKNLSVRQDRAGGYITLACAQGIAEALADYERANDIVPGSAWTELFVACTNRMYLGEDERKNSASPSPSEPTPEVSIPIETTAAAGPSPASATSTETPATS